MYFFTEFVPKYLAYLLQGALVTLELSFISMAARHRHRRGLAPSAPSPAARSCASVVQAYVSICRGVPLIVILLFVYFTLPEVGIRFPAFWAGVVGLSINLGAYLERSLPRRHPGGRFRPDAGGALALGMKQHRRSIARSSCPRRPSSPCPPWAAISSRC